MIRPRWRTANPSPNNLILNPNATLDRDVTVVKHSISNRWIAFYGKMDSAELRRSADPIVSG